jgi:hypothetical protein
MHGDAGTPKLFADRAPTNGQLGTDLAQGQILGVQVGRTRNVHRAKITSLGRLDFSGIGMLSLGRS